MSRIVRWNPIREMAAMQRMMDRVLDESLRSTYDTEGEELQGAPLALDVHENETEYTVTTSLPGVDADNIDVNLHDDFLTITAEIPETVVENENGRTLLRERHYGKFSRRIRLPQPVNSDNVEAAYDNGVLTLTLPKSEAVLPRSIPVKALKSGDN